MRVTRGVAVMASEGKMVGPLDPAGLAERFQTLATKSQAAVQGFLVSRPDVANIGMGDPAQIGQAFFELTTNLMADPRPVARAQLELWEQSVSLWARTLRHLLGGEPAPVGALDKRFKHSEWAENAIFSYIRDSYLLSARAILSAVRGVKGLDDETSSKVEFYTKQFVDALAPSNFLATNPEVLSKTIETGGENLLSGLTNLLNDLERGKGRLSVTMTDMNAFRLGENIATTPGKVVFQNEMIQLIQYTPMTEQVRKTPLLIIPPWINKFYVLDLQPRNSFIRWCVEQGHTVFVISWVNPDARQRDKSFEHYMLEGAIAAMAAVEKATGERAVNCVGYCLGGTLLASTLGYLAAKGDDRVKSATYFVTLVDFVESGDMSVFIDTEQLAALEARMNEKGYLDAQDMATSFNMLRANDLIWSFVVNNYLLGKEPVPFDLLYWNSDTTRMPLKLHLAYLRQCYRDNALAKAQMILGGERLNITKIQTPAFFQAAKEDHIAPAASVYKGAKLFGGPVTYMLAGSGHIAGVINAPVAGKYQHWTNEALPATLKEWQAGAVEHPGSWWPDWDGWLAPRSGER